MLKIKLTKNVLLSSLILANLAGTFAANAAGFNHTKTNDGITMSSEKFYATVEKTKSNQVAANFGFPDNIVTMRNPTGEVTGVVWVYRNAVNKQNKVMDASFVILDGEFKYVALSNAS